MSKENQKLLTLADACSDVLYGGEAGWENVEFKQFVSDCRKAIVFGVKCKNAGLEPPEKEPIQPSSGKEDSPTTSTKGSE